MPINLTAPFDPGELDGDYSQFKILHFTMNVQAGKITIVGTYGNTAGGVFTPGVAAPVKTWEVAGQALLDMIALMPEAGEKLYDGVARVLYDYIQQAEQPSSRLEGAVVS